ncbi:TonB-dependent receptor [Paracoccus sp. 11-3]|uniref:TonB-dependent receptor n=1 Tax=Paracoccus amoyensis TaxID=2760093 RepID=A0A926GDD1_9RHOB|nr:TonB-dependent receptor [Paracoccus amoyensis]MBC9247065.1 TonB-dependent receptor [Paracoccus amoyensis]
MPCKTRLFTTSIILTLTTALPALAQDDTPYALPPITLTANREATDLDKSGSSVSIITPQELNGRAGEPLSDTLSRLPGVTIRQSGPLGTTGSISVRGAPSHYLPVVIDGIEVSDAAAGQPAYDIGGLIGADVAQGELLRGAQSALYGSRAVSGVLTLQSPRPTEEGVHHNVTAEAGSYNTWLARYGVTMRRNATDLAFSATRIETDGFSALDENDGNFEDDGYEATRLTFYAAHELQGGAKIGVNGFWEDSTSHFDDWSGDVVGSTGDDYTDRESFGLRGFAEFQTGAIDHALALTRYRMDRTSYQNNFPTDFTGTRTKLSWQGATDLGTNGARLIFGADSEKEAADGYGDTRTNGVFAELTTPVGQRADLSLSLRHDNHSEFGDFTSGRIAGVYRLRDDLLLRAAYGNGFRAPSLYELYGPYGDETLMREESRSAEIGIEKQWGADSYLRLTTFWLKATSLIGWDDRGTPDWSDDGYNQVDGDARRKGVELDGRYAFGAGYALTGSYTYIDNEVASEWAEVPGQTVNLGIEGSFATGTTAALNMRYVGDRPQDLGDFTVVDLLVTHPLRDNSEVYLRIENLFDEQYQLVNGYGTSDRAFYAGVRASF